MKLKIVFLMAVLSPSVFAESELFCKNSARDRLHWNEYRGELIVYRQNGSRILDMGELELDKPRRVRGNQLIDILPMHGNYSTVATIVKGPRGTSVIHEGVEYVCDSSIED